MPLAHRNGSARHRRILKTFKIEAEERAAEDPSLDSAVQLVAAQNILAGGSANFGEQQGPAGGKTGRTQRAVMQKKRRMAGMKSRVARSFPYYKGQPIQRDFVDEGFYLQTCVSRFRRWRCWRMQVAFDC